MLQSLFSRHLFHSLSTKPTLTASRSSLLRLPRRLLSSTTPPPRRPPRVDLPNKTPRKLDKLFQFEPLVPVQQLKVRRRAPLWQRVAVPSVLGALAAFMYGMARLENYTFDVEHKHKLPTDSRLAQWVRAQGALGEHAEVFHYNVPLTLYKDVQAGVLDASKEHVSLGLVLTGFEHFLLRYDYPLLFESRAAADVLRTQAVPDAPGCGYELLGGALKVQDKEASQGEVICHHTKYDGVYVGIRLDPFDEDEDEMLDHVQLAMVVDKRKVGFFTRKLHLRVERARLRFRLKRSVDFVRSLFGQLGIWWRKEDAMDGASKLEYALKAYEEVKEQSKQ